MAFPTQADSARFPLPFTSMQAGASDLDGSPLPCLEASADELAMLLGLPGSLEDTPVWRQPGIPRQHATPGDFEQAVQELRLEPGSAVTDRQEVAARLARQGKFLRRGQMQPWLALEWPERFTQLPGLRLFLPAMTEACRRDPAVLVDPGAFHDAAVRALGPGRPDLRTLAFLARQARPVVAYIAYKAGAAPGAHPGSPTPASGGKVYGMRACSTRILAEAAAIRQYVGQWCEHGFPVHWSEIQVLLAGRRAPLSRTQIAHIPAVLADIAQHTGWYFPVGQAPDVVREFPLGLPATPLFRGSTPDAPVLLACGAPNPQRGLFAALMLVHSAGFTRAQAVALLRAMEPTMSADSCERKIRHALQDKRLLSTGAGRLIVNPDLLCRDKRLAMLANCAPHTGAARANDAARIFEVMAALRQAGELGPYIRTQASGRRRFQLPAIAATVRRRFPGVADLAAFDVLQGVQPANLEEVLLAAQWLKPHTTRIEFDRHFQELDQVFPLFHSLSYCALAALINKRDPQRYCDAARLRRYCRSQPDDEPAMRAEIDRLIADGRIYLFCLGSTARHMETRSLRNHLTLRGIGCNRAALAGFLARRAPAIAHGSERYIPSGLHALARNKDRSARDIMRRLALAPGQPPPAWPDFITAFELLFSARGPGQKPLRYSARSALDIHQALVDQLHEKLKPARPAAATAAGTKRKRSAAALPGTANTSPKRLRGASPDPDPSPTPPQLFLRSGAGSGGLACLVDAMRNARQDAQCCPLPEGADLHDACIADLPRIAPHGDWVTLELDQRSFAAWAPVLSEQLDCGVFYRGDTLRTVHGTELHRAHFAALCRSVSTPWLLDAQWGAAQPLAPQDTLARIGTPDGQLRAALPLSACHGAIGQCVSYQGLPGFLPACDAIQAMLGGTLPVREFAGWLDRQPGLPPELPHLALDALRKAACGAVELGQVAAFMAECSPQRWALSAPLPDRAPGSDRAFMLAVEQWVRGAPAGQPFLLKAGADIAVLALDGEQVWAWARGACVPWTQWMRELSRDAHVLAPTPRASLFVPTREAASHTDSVSPP